MTQQKLGIDQIIKVLDLILEAGNVSEKVASATSVVSKVMALVPLSDELLRLLSLSPIVLKAQWADLDSDERKELNEYMREKLDLQDDALEAKIEAGLVLVNQAVEFIDQAINYAKDFKKKEEG